MPKVSVDNTPVVVALGTGETFSPASGVVIRANIIVSEGGSVTLKRAGTSVGTVIAGFTSNVSGGETVVLDDQTTVEEPGGNQAYISGFEV